MENFKKVLSALLCMMIIVSSCSLFVSAKINSVDYETAKENAEEKAENEEEKEPEEKNIDVEVCANKGNWYNAPENSAQAVSACGCKYVSVDVKVTSDKVPILMADETIDRTCADSNGKSAKGKVSELTYEKIRKYCLRNRNGGPHNEITANTVPTLENIIELTADKILILDFALEDFEDVYKTVYSEGVQSRVIFRINGKTEDILSALRKKEKVPETIIKYDGNIIFSVNSAIKHTKNSGLHMVQLGTKNQYGVIFYKNVENSIKENGLTAVFSMTDGFSGKRSDNVTGWDDVISHGYKIIETDYPDLLTQYVSNSTELRQKLTEITVNKDEYSKGKYPKNLLEGYSKAYKAAVNCVENTASQSQLAKAYTDLNNARSALNLAEGTTTSQSVLNFSAGRIIAAVLCLAAAIAAQIFFYKRRK